MNPANMDPVNDKLEPYYAKCFAEHGASARGVDWHDADSLAFHYDRMLDVIRPEQGRDRPSFLDIGCGYGGLLDRARQNGLNIDYTGLDLVGGMVEHGRRTHPDATFLQGDVLSYDFGRRFDYIAANGVLTEKLDVSIPEFRRFARRMVARMFDLCERGIAFNMMTSYVNFMADNLFYENPADMVSFCASELSPKWKIDHAYRYYDFTMYVYR